jgi:DNA-binding IclR family transcriptional regulator
MDVGSRVPLHCTASGKLFLAHLPDAERQQLLAQLPLPKLTPTTITRTKDLRAECARIAQCGHSLDRGEFIAGLVALAVPVRDDSGRVRAALAVHAPSARMSIEQALQRLPAMTAAALRMGRLL